MSRILKRPMFRRGGSPNQGIMTGLVDRKGYNIGGIDRERLEADTRTITDLLDEYAPISKTRVPYGQFGLNIASGMSLTDALKDPYKQFTTKDDARRALIDKRKQGALSTALAGQLKKPKTPTTKEVRNISDKPLFGIEPGGKGFVTDAQILSAQGKLTKPTAGGLDIQFNADGSIKSITEGGVSDTKAAKEASQVKIKAFQMNNAAQNLISNLNNAKTGPMGATIMALDSTGAQFKQLANSFGFKTTGANKTYDEQGDAVDQYIEKHFGSTIGGDAEKFAKIKSVAINLAYLMARIDEPGGRFTDRDIALKMEEMGLGADPERTIAVLINSLQIRNSNAAFEYKELTGGKILDWSDIDVVGKIPSFGEDTTQKKTIRGKVVDDNDPAGIR